MGESSISNQVRFQLGPSPPGSPSPDPSSTAATSETPLLPQPSTARASAGRAKRKCAVENVGLAACLFVLAAFFCVIIFENQWRPADRGSQYIARGKNGAVSSDVAECSQIGVDAMKKGGNAVDAAIAAGVCIGTVNMYASGVGGGGFMVVRMADGESRTFNFRERAPERAHRDMYEGKENEAQRGGLAVGVPGEVHGFATAHQHYGMLPWKELWEPSASLAEDGFQMNSFFNKVMAKKASHFYSHREEWQCLFDNETGLLAKEGDLIRRPEFATTLRTIAGSGDDQYAGVQEFYNGSIAWHLVHDIRAAGGIITEEDFSSYFTAVTPTVNTTFYDHTVLTCPPPCSGHVMLEGLNIISHIPYYRSRAAQAAHYLVEAMKWLSAGRTELGDPFDPVVANNTDRIYELITPSYASAVAANISASQTYPASHYHPAFEPNNPAGTSQISVLDHLGNAVSLTTTINLYWGNLAPSVKTGIVLNSEMDDFALPGHTNVFDLKPSVYNFIIPGKRPLSSSAPAVVVDDATGQAVFVIGASGGSRIVTAVFQAIVNRILGRMSVLDTVQGPRLHHQLVPERVEAEAAVAPDVIAGLEKRGHEVLRKGAGAAGGSVLHVCARGEGGQKMALADWWRKGGSARAW